MTGTSGPDHDDNEPAARGPRARAGGAVRFLSGIGALLVLAGVAAWSVLSLHPPAPAGVDAPPGSFSADRAMEQVEQSARVPHPTGSVANDEVRAHLIDRLTGLGLQPRVNSALGVVVRGPDRVNAAAVDNVVAVLPGTDPTGRIFLAAHYDSAQFSPGAGDDSAGTAAILEIARALQDAPPLRNDIVLLFTDAEESGTIGSEGFLASSPLAADGGVVLNFEARGASGPVVMFETSEGNAALARLYAATAPHPAATSAAVEVYRRLRNNTDFTNFLKTGDFTGMNSAFFDGAAVYHTPQDVPERLSGASLQAMGDNGLALTRALGSADLADYARPAPHDETYFTVPGAVAHYPGFWVWPLAGLSVALTGAVATIAWRTRRATILRLVAGTAAALFPLVLAPLAAYGVWRLLVLIRPGYGSVLDLWRPTVLRIGVIVLAVAVFLAFLALARRWIGATAATFGCLVWLTVLGVVFAALAPGAAYLATLPALATGTAAAVALSARMPGLRAAATLAGSVVAVLVLAPAIAMFFASLGMPMAAGPALFTVLLCFAAAPTLDLLFTGSTADDAVTATAESTTPGRRRHRLATAAVPLTAFASAAVLLGVGTGINGFDARHPEPAQLMYALDADTGSAHWLSENAPTDYTRRYLDTEADAGDYLPFTRSGRDSGPLEPAEVSGYFPYIHQTVHVGPAPTAALPTPTLDVVSDARAGGVRTITVHASPGRPVRMITVGVDTDGGTVEGVRLESPGTTGRDLAGDAVGSSTSAVTFHGPTARGITLRYRISGDGPVRLRAVGGSDGLDGLPGYFAPPDGVDIAGTHSSGLLMVATETVLD
ncbi:M20/M25/M40 family metallo-hydrolase [Tomitella gaofuii]|uniref:M20/M25/M40 family metallo-hydrolase n=1 Tax=Tomitella gaofuii TaxID=2760083 RepID=UPI0015F87299|nr:M20/M25/M40 family metallo-hydrolase [Tomitella gaofuii]